MPFASAQQIVEVGLQVGQERDVGAEVITAGAAEPDRTRPATGLDVGRLGAGAVGDGDLADGVAGAFGFQQGVRVAPDPVAVPVEAERGDGIDGRAATVFADPVVAPGHRIAAVIEQFSQHIDRHPGIGVTLGIAVPVDVGTILVLSTSIPSRVPKAGKAEIHSRCRASSMSMLIGVRLWGLRRGVGSSASSAGGV